MGSDRESQSIAGLNHVPQEFSCRCRRPGRCRGGGHHGSRPTRRAVSTRPARARTRRKTAPSSRPTKPFCRLPIGACGRLGWRAARKSAPRPATPSRTSSRSARRERASFHVPGAGDPLHGLIARPPGQGPTHRNGRRGTPAGGLFYVRTGSAAAETRRRQAAPVRLLRLASGPPIHQLGPHGDEHDRRWRRRAAAGRPRTSCWRASIARKTSRT